MASFVAQTGNKDVMKSHEINKDSEIYSQIKRYFCVIYFSFIITLLFQEDYQEKS